MTISAPERLAMRNQTLMLAQAENDKEARMWMDLILDGYRSHIRADMLAKGVPAQAFESIVDAAHIESWIRSTEGIAAGDDCGEFKETMLLAAARARRLVGM